MVCVVRVLMLHLVCCRVVFLVHCCFCCTLLTFLGYFRMYWLVMRATLPCFVKYHILVNRDRLSVAASLNDDLAVISDCCSRWGMLSNPSKTRGMLFSRSHTVEPLFPDLVVDGTVVEMVSELNFGCYSKLKVSLREASQSNSCFCLEEGWYFEEDNESFSRCRCLDVCSHFPPVVA